MDRQDDGWKTRLQAHALNMTLKWPLKRGHDISLTQVTLSLSPPRPGAWGWEGPFMLQYRSSLVLSIHKEWRGAGLLGKVCGQQGGTGGSWKGARQAWVGKLAPSALCWMRDVGRRRERP